MKTVKLQILSSIILLLSFSCHEKTEKQNINHSNLCKVQLFNLTDTLLYRMLKEDIENYKYNINSLFLDEHCFIIYPNPNDSTLFYMCAREEFICSPNTIGVFFIDTISISIGRMFNKKHFEFKGHIEMHGRTPDTTVYESTVPYMYNPLIWEYKWLSDSVIRAKVMEY